jgi:hypothetical protein
MTDDELEDYGFEYSDEDPDEADVDAENQYYFAKGKLSSILSMCSSLHSTEFLGHTYFVKQLCWKQEVLKMHLMVSRQY